jgi:hypothetical protein
MLTLALAACPLGACNPHIHVQHSDAVSGDSPQEVAASITYMRQTLDAQKEAQFTQAISTLSLVVPDKNDGGSVGYISPQFTQMVKGRNADQIIQLAQLYRLSVPAARSY